MQPVAKPARQMPIYLPLNKTTMASIQHTQFYDLSKILNIKPQHKNESNSTASYQYGFVQLYVCLCGCGSVCAVFSFGNWVQVCAHDCILLRFIFLILQVTLNHFQMGYRRQTVHSYRCRLFLGHFDNGNSLQTL